MEKDQGLDKLFSEEGRASLSLEAEEYPTPGVYVAILSQQYKGTRLGDYSVRISELAVLPDDELGIEPELPYAKSFYRGELLALRLVAKFLNVETIQQIPKQRIPVPANDKESTGEYRGAAVQGILTYAAAGYKRASQYHDLLDEWAEQLAANEDSAEYVALGFGFFIQLAYDTTHNASPERQSMVDTVEALARGEVDVDAEIQRLLEGQ